MPVSLSWNEMKYLFQMNTKTETIFVCVHIYSPLKETDSNACSARKHLPINQTNTGTFETSTKNEFGDGNVFYA